MTIKKSIDHTGFKIQSFENANAEEDVVTVDDFRNVFDTFRILAKVQLECDEFIDIDETVSTLEELARETSQWMFNRFHQLP